MKQTRLKERIDLLSREILRNAAERVGKPTNPVVDDFTEIVDPAANLTGYPSGNITYQESLAAGDAFKKLLTYMSQRADDETPIDEIEETVLELIVNSSKLYAHIILNKPKEVK